MTNFEFNGDWEYTIQLPAFAGFMAREGFYRPEDQSSLTAGAMTLEIEEDLSENDDPYPSQLNTINYIFENQEKIVQCILEKVLRELPETLILYGYENEEMFRDLTSEKIRSLISLNFIRILMVSKDDFAYYDISGSCTWDEEHGLTFSVYKDKVLAFGGIEGDSLTIPLKDGGIELGRTPGATKNTVPKKYLPGKKYNKLKPSHEYANKSFEHHLISFGHNAIFIGLVEKGGIDINGIYKAGNKTYLELACWFKNNLLVEFLLKKGATIRYALHETLGYNSNIEAFDLILKYGGNLNAQDLSGNTALNILAQQLADFYSSKQQQIHLNLPENPEMDTKLHDQRERLKTLIKKGADPYIKNSAGHNCFSMPRNLNDHYKTEMLDFINACLR